MDVIITTLIISTAVTIAFLFVCIAYIKLGNIAEVAVREDVAQESISSTLESLRRYAPLTRMLGIMSISLLLTPIIVQVDNYILINSASVWEPFEINWAGYVQAGNWTVATFFLAAYMITSAIQTWTCFTLTNACCGRKLVQLNVCLVFSIIFFALYIIIAVVFNIPDLGDRDLNLAPFKMSLSAMSGAPVVIFLLVCTKVKDVLRKAGFADNRTTIEICTFIHNKWQSSDHVQLDELAQAFGIALHFTEMRLKYYLERRILHGTYDPSTKRYNFAPKLDQAFEKEIDSLNSQFSRWNASTKERGEKI